MNDDIITNLAHWRNTVLSAQLPRWNNLPEIDLYMDQVMAYMDKYLYIFGSQSSKLISPSIINNYVKLKIIPPPLKKKYSRIHLAYLIIICVLKQILPISAIQDMINIQLKDNTIENLYDKFCNLQEAVIVSICKKIHDEDKNIITLNDMLKDPIDEDTGLKIAIIANFSKIVAEKIIFFQQDLLPKEPKQDKQHKNKPSSKS